MSHDFRHLIRRPNHRDGDDPFVTASKLVSKETSKSNPSFRVYYGDVPSAIPFTWESTPGTPKHKSSEDSRIPPLTPPPSYYSNNLIDKSSKKHSRSKQLLRGLLRRMVTRDSSSGLESPRHVSSSSSSSLSNSSASWSSSAHSSFSDPSAFARKRRRFSSWGSVSSVVDDTRCFGSGKRRNRGGYSVMIVKRALLSIVGRG